MVCNSSAKTKYVQRMYERGRERESDEYEIICIQVPFSIFINSFSISLSRISMRCCCCCCCAKWLRKTQNSSIGCATDRDEEHVTRFALIIQIAYYRFVRLLEMYTQCIGTRTPAFMCALYVWARFYKLSKYSTHLLLGENGRFNSKNGFVIFNLSRLCIGFAHECVVWTAHVNGKLNVGMCMCVCRRIPFISNSLR